MYSKTILIIILSFALQLLYSKAVAQDYDISRHLSNSDDKERYEEIKEEIRVADDLFSEANQADGSTAYRVHKKASKTYDINYRSLYMLLAPYLDNFTEKSEGEKRKKIRVLNFTASDNFGMAISKRREAAELDKDEAIAKLKAAHEHDQKAEQALYKAFAVYYDAEDFEIEEDDPYTIAALEKRENFKDKEFSEKSYEPEQNTSERKYPTYKKPTAIEVADTKHSYSVQIASSVKPEDISYLNRRYPKTGDIREEQVGGRYKYTFGNFSSYREASKARENCGVKGAFVIAYNGNKRLKHISDVLLPEDQQTYEGEVNRSQNTANAEETDDGSKNNEVAVADESNKAVEYRVQIGTSRIPASQSQLNEMNKTDLPVKTIKNAKLYKYSVGSFDSYQEAKNFINTNGLQKAFVVKFENGQEVSLD
jgi:hypothetical protein